MTLDAVLNLGFFEAMRLWGIQDEIKARDLAFFSRAIDLPHAKDENRKEFNDWLVSRQPRRAPKQNVIPSDIMEAFLKRWNDG